MAIQPADNDAFHFQAEPNDLDVSIAGYYYACSFVPVPSVEGEGDSE